MQILYEDSYLTIAVKPVGVLSEDTPDSLCMPALLRQHYHGGYIATVHRLDKVVGGVMLFSRSPAVSGKLIQMVAERQVTKEYLAVLRGHPEKREDTLSDFLFHDSRTNKSFVVDRMRKGVREAKLHYEELDRSEDFSLVKVQLCTGRTHQIRVQFSHRKLPLLGDIRYGSKAYCSPALWSYHLAFIHPVTGEKVDVSCPPPASYPWNLFLQ